MKFDTFLCVRSYQCTSWKYISRSMKIINGKMKRVMKCSMGKK